MSRNGWKLVDPPTVEINFLVRIHAKREGYQISVVAGRRDSEHDVRPTEAIVRLSRDLVDGARELERVSFEQLETILRFPGTVFSKCHRG